MDNEHIEKLYSSAYKGDSRARQELINLAGVNPSWDSDVFVALSILEGKDTRNVIKHYAKLGNREAIASWGSVLLEEAKSFEGVVKALCWLEEAGNAGCARAFGFLASRHWYGDDGVPQSSQLAMQYCVKTYHLGDKSAAQFMAKMLYDHLKISDVMLGDAVDWCRLSVRECSDRDAEWKLADILKRYGEDRIASAPRVIPNDFHLHKMEHYISQYGHPSFGLFD